MKSKKALVPGTFDPVTRGHLALIEAAAALFDKVTVCILINPEKHCMFDEDTRKKALKAAVRGLDNVTIASCHGMTADYAKEIGADAIVRGIRDEKDAVYELEMADFNLRRTGVKTVFFPAPPELRTLSSTQARESLLSGEMPETSLPAGVPEILQREKRNGAD